MRNNSEINHLIAEILEEECEKEDNQDIEKIIQKVLHRAIEDSAIEKNTTTIVKDYDKIFREFI